MKSLKLFSLLLVLSLSQVAFAGEPSVKILSPVDGATLDLMAENRVQYVVVPGPRGDHVHFYVDGDEEAVLRQLEGRYLLGSLTEGRHELCIKVVNKNHTPIGVEQCISVMME
jgi:hypothetical protein